MTQISNYPKVPSITRGLSIEFREIMAEFSIADYSKLKLVFAHLIHLTYVVLNEKFDIRFLT